jgi:hypothetical protein
MAGSRLAQRRLRAQARAHSSRSHGQGGHSSSTIAMSLPRLAWIAITSRGPRKSFEPSRCDWNATPSSRTSRSFARLKTWKPPLSVRMGRPSP